MSYKTEYGFTFPETYWALTSYTFDTIEGMVDFVFTGFVNQQAKLEKSKAIGQYHVRATAEEFTYFRCKHLLKQLDMGQIGYALAARRKDKLSGIQQIVIGEDPEGGIIYDQRKIFTQFFDGAIDIEEPKPSECTLVELAPSL